MDKKDRSSDFNSAFYGPRYWPTWMALGLLWLIGQLPLSVSLKIGDLLGRLFFYVARERRRIAEINIALCFPELSAAQQEQLVRGTLRSVGMNLIEGAAALWGPSKMFRGRHTVTGLEHIAAARARGQGVLLVGAHFTTIDVSGRVLCEHERFDVLYRTDSNALLDYMIRRARETFAGNAIPRTDTRQMIKYLRQGHIIWYAPDQDYRTQHRVFAPFFGVPAATIVGTSRIARLGQAAVLPVAHFRDEHGCYHVNISPALENFPSGDDVADATRINSIIEAAVRRYPEQYLWVHRRFKTRPPGEPPVYPPKKKKRSPANTVA